MPSEMEGWLGAFSTNFPCGIAQRRTHSLLIQRQAGRAIIDRINAGVDDTPKRVTATDGCHDRPQRPPRRKATADALPCDPS